MTKQWTSNLKRVISLVAIMLVISAHAQTVVQADNAALQPQIKRDANGFVSCGVRGVAIVVSGKSVDAYDFSVMANADMPYGTMKAGKSVTTVEKVAKGDAVSGVVLPKPEYFWIAQESDGEAVMPIKVIAAENAGFILEITDLVKTFKAIYSMISGDRMQFVVRYKKQKMDTVVSFGAQMSEVERRPLLACMEGISNRLAAEYKEGR
jgi:hypothetical protein